MSLPLPASLPARVEADAAPRDRSAAAIRPALALGLALALVALAYAGVPASGFVWDDHLLIDEQPFTHELRPLSDYFGRLFWSDPTNPEDRAFYRPLVSLSYALEWQLWGGRAGSFHVTNLLLHLGCCALVYLLGRQAGAAVPAAAAGAALFGAFPRLTESVAWISGRTDVVAGLFGLSALALHRTGRGRAGWRVGAGAALLAGLLAKEVAAAAAVAIAAQELARRRRRAPAWRETLAHLAPSALALAAYTTMRLRAWAPEAVAEDVDHLLLERLVWFPLQALGHYGWMLLDPLRPQTQIGSLGVVEPRFVAFGVAVALALLGLVAWAWRGWSARGCALLALGLAALAPVLHVLPLAVNVVAADRFLYLPAAALFAGLAAASGRLRAPARRALGAAALVAIANFAFATAWRTPVWGDDLLLWRDAAAHAPRGNAMPSARLGDVLSWRGDPEGAIAAYRETLRIQREYPLYGRRFEANPNLLANLGLVLSEVGRYAEAGALLAHVTAMRPTVPVYWLQRAAVEGRALDFDAAQASLGRALALTPDYPLARQIGAQLEQARARLAALPSEAPGEPPALAAERATVYTLVGRLRDADRLWSQLAADPAASPGQVRAAARHLATRGHDPAAARAALARLARTGADPRQVAQLTAALEARGLIE